MRRRTVATAAIVGVALITASFVAHGAGALLNTNEAMLDDGTCGHNLQLGSDVNASQSNTPTFLLAGDGGLSTYAMKIDGVSIGSFNSDGHGNVCILDTVVFADGAHSLTGTETRPNPANPVTPYNFTIDTTPPATPSTPALDPAADSGVKGDGITNITQLRFNGSATPSIAVHIMQGTQLLGGAVSDSTGHWAVTTTSQANGTHTVDAITMDTAGNFSAPSGTMSVTVDNVAPAAPPKPTLDPASDSAPTGDNATSVTSPVVDGAGAEPAATISVYVDGVKVGTTSADANGNWQYQLSNLAIATHNITATATDAAANTSAQSAAYALSISGSATLPSAPVVTAVAGNATVALSWPVPNNGGAAITGYKIYRSASSGAEALYTTVGGTTTSYTDLAVMNGTTYYYQVTATNSVGEGARSVEISSTPSAPNSPPSPPVLTATAGTASVSLTWTVPASGSSAITGYKVYRATTSGGETALTTVGTTSYNDGAVVAGTTYYYQVTAVSSIGESSRSVERPATPTASATVPSAPSSSASAGNANVALSWSTPANGGSAITGYKVYRGTTSGGESLLTSVGSATTSYNDTSTANGTTYYYQVTATNSVGESARSTETSATPMTTPSAATLTASAGTNNVALSWTVPSNGGSAITGYSIYRGTTSGGEALFTTVSAATTSYTDGTATSGTTYYYQVTATNGVGEGARSAERSATPSAPATVPLSPILNAAGGNANVALTWVPPSSDGGSPITGYRLYRGTASGGETLFTTVGASTTTYNDSTVSNGTKYFYFATATNAVGESAHSPEVSATPMTVPTAPTLSATANNGSVSLSWTVPANGGSAINGYKLYRGTTSGGEGLLIALGSSTTSMVDNSIVNGTTYYYQVSATNAAGESVRSTQMSATPTAPVGTSPGAPGLSGTASAGQVALSWTVPANGGNAITGYRVYRSTSAGTEVLYSSVNASTTTFNDTSVTNGTTYFYVVTAVNSQGESARSNEVAATPVSAPSAPLSLTARSLTKGGIRIDWIAPANGGSAITGYRIYRGTSPGAETFFLAVSGSTLSYPDTSANRHVTYYYRVTAVNAFGESARSNEASASAR
jgi:VCBS repeat-containing protein